MQDKIAPVLKKCKEQLMLTPLNEWVDFIEKAASTAHLSKKGSIQEAVNEFICAYGPIAEPFSANLFLPASPLGLILHETPNRANLKQLKPPTNLPKSLKTVKIVSITASGPHLPQIFNL